MLVANLVSLNLQITSHGTLQDATHEPLLREESVVTNMLLMDLLHVLRICD